MRAPAALLLICCVASVRFPSLPKQSAVELKGQRLVADGSTVGVAQVLPYCLEIKTRSTEKGYAAGPVEVMVNAGSGLETVASGFHAEGSILLSKCYASEPQAVQVQGTTRESWVGTIGYSTNSGETYGSLICADCHGENKNSFLPYYVAAASRELYHPERWTDCGGGRSCTFKPAAAPRPAASISPTAPDPRPAASISPTQCTDLPFDVPKNSYWSTETCADVSDRYCVRPPVKDSCCKCVGGGNRSVAQDPRPAAAISPTAPSVAQETPSRAAGTCDVKGSTSFCASNFVSCCDGKPDTCSCTLARDGNGTAFADCAFCGRFFRFCCAKFDCDCDVKE